VRGGDGERGVRGCVEEGYERESEGMVFKVGGDWGSSGLEEVGELGVKEMKERAEEGGHVPNGFPYPGTAASLSFATWAGSYLRRVPDQQRRRHMGGDEPPSRTFPPKLSRFFRLEKQSLLVPTRDQCRVVGPRGWAARAVLCSAASPADPTRTTAGSRAVITDVASVHTGRRSRGKWTGFSPAWKSRKGDAERTVRSSRTISLGAWRPLPLRDDSSRRRGTSPP